MRRLNTANWHTAGRHAADRLASAVLGVALLCGGPARPAPAVAGHAATTSRLLQNQAVVLTGAAQWCLPSGGPVPLRLGRPHSVSSGDVLRCGPHSRLRMRLTGNPFAVDNPDDVWQDWPIPARTARTSQSGPYLPTLGRTRGMAIILPTPVSPQGFVIAWLPDPGGKPLTLCLLAPGRKVLWQQAGVDAGSGCLFSPKARRALVGYQAGGGEGQMTLLFLREGKPLQQIRFTLRPPS